MRSGACWRMLSRMRRTPISPAGKELVRIIQRNRAESLGAYFRSLARASITASALFGAACGASHGGEDAGADAGRIVADAGSADDAGKDAGSDGGADAGDPPFDAGAVSVTRPICEGLEWQAVAGLNPAGSYDYLAAYSGICGGCAPEGYVIDEQGTRCATASDVPACEAEVDMSAMIFARHLVTTDASTVQRYLGASEVAGFLGQIDTAQEALLVLWHQGYDVTCDETTVMEVADGYEVVTTIMVADCPVMVERRRVHVSRDATVTVLESEALPSSGACIGRRPPGLRAGGPLAGSELACFFADVARLEASSVPAFERIARELEALGAPRDLVDGALAASDDEVRHAYTIAGLARRLGAEPHAPIVDPLPLRGLYELALDNAIEGCVRETFGALVGHHQAQAARDPELRAIFERIAEDETRHAALSWSIAAWAEPELDGAERARLREARERAIVELRAEMSAPRCDELYGWAGFPAPASAARLVDALEQSIWS